MLNGKKISLILVLVMLISNVIVYANTNEDSFEILTTNETKNLLNELKEARSIASNDTYYNNLWYIPYINADIISGYSTGEGITVAVLDGGFQLDHEDLSANMLSDKYEEYIVPGSGDNHGTHVSGIIGAVKNNNKGICGIAPDANILPIGCVSGMAGGVNLYQAITYAKNNGAKIVNMSFETNYSATVENLINSCTNMLFVASAGNEGSQTTNHYPSNFDAPNIISVGNLTQAGTLASNSNYGSTVDIAAPGTQIYSSIKNNSYDYKSGTSMAAACVSGTGALVAEISPSLNGERIKNIILSASDTLNSLNGKINGKRALNAGQAVLNASVGLRNIQNVEEDEYRLKNISKNCVDLDNYVYGTGKNLIVQVEDSKNINEYISNIEKEIQVSDIEIREYNEDLDIYIIELPINLTRTIAEDILNSENVLYAEPMIIKVAN